VKVRIFVNCPTCGCPLMAECPNGAAHTGRMPGEAKNAETDRAIARRIGKLARTVNSASPDSAREGKGGI
jgi:hypothetical protein